MFDVVVVFMTQLVNLIIPMIGIYVIFDFIGTLLFGKR